MRLAIIVVVSVVALVLAASVACADDATQLTTDPGRDMNPAWSEDGNWVLFDSDREDGEELWRIPASGGAAERLTFNPGGDAEPACSADGLQVAWDTNRDGVWRGIWRMPYPSGVPAQVTPGQNDHDPCWSPDGSQIAYANESDGKIWLVDVASGAQSSLTNAIGAQPAWSPDGTTIAFRKYMDFSNSDIWLVDVGTGVETPLTDHIHYEEGPTWSPDGTKIAYRRWSSIWIMDLGTMEPEQITFNSEDTEPSWSPGGTTIAFRRYEAAEFDIYLIDVGGTSVAEQPLEMSWGAMKALYR